MTRFGTYKLPTVLQAEIQASRVEIERNVPYRAVAYRSDQTTHGRTLTLSGEIRYTTISETALRIELLRRLADDTTRVLDLEDGTTPAFNAIMISPSYTVGAGDWFPGKYHVPYSVSFLEVA
jgi:hypothetical protein